MKIHLADSLLFYQFLVLGLDFRDLCLGAQFHDHTVFVFFFTFPGTFYYLNVFAEIAACEALSLDSRFPFSFHYGPHFLSARCTQVACVITALAFALRPLVTPRGEVQEMT